jgi:hypothetical protein
MASKVMDADERKAAILDAGAKLAAKVGAKNVTRRAVAKAAKVSEALVAHYIGGKDDAQKAYAKHAKKLGLTLPEKAKEEAIGKKMRAHGPRKPAPPRKRSAREVEAIKRKEAAKPSVQVRGKTVTVKTRKSGGDARLVPIPKSVLDGAKTKSKPAAPSNKALPAAPSNKRTIAPKPAPGAATGPVLPSLPASGSTS